MIFILGSRDNKDSYIHSRMNINYKGMIFILGSRDNKDKFILNKIFIFILEYKL
jgi:hypothetical protein